MDTDPTHPTGHGFNGANDDMNVPHNSGRLITAIRSNFPPPSSSGPSSALSASPSHHSTAIAPPPVLEERYQKIIDELPPGNNGYREEMFQLCLGLQQQGEVPNRPSSEDVKDLFRNIPHPKASTGKGSKGGMKHHECLWPGCEFKDTLQKGMDHLFSKHMKVKFFRCGVNGCRMTFVRKFDCDKHKDRSHNIPRPRAAGRTTPAPAPVRNTRASTRAAPY